MLSAVLVGATPMPTIYSAPAGSRLAGAPDPARPYNVVLPNGRIVAPVGQSIVVGMNALSLAIAPGGRYAIVGNDDEREGGAASRLQPRAHGGFSLAVVNLKTMALIDSYTSANLSLFMGLVAVKDPANRKQTLVMAAGGGSNTVLFFHLDGQGKLHLEPSYLSLPGPTDERYGNRSHAYPGWIAVSANGRTAYVVNNLANTVTAVNIASRKAMHTAGVGFFPWGAAIAGRNLYVTNRGLMRYAMLAQPATTPPLANFPFSPSQSSSLSTLSIAQNGDIGEPLAATPMDPAPDGVNVVGGAAPSAIVTSKNGRYAYVCMANVDRVAVVSYRECRASSAGCSCGCSTVRRMARSPMRSRSAPTANGCTWRLPA